MPVPRFVNHRRLAALVLTALWLAASLPPARAAEGADRPPREIVETGACPFEGCQLGRWTAREQVVLYQAPSGVRLKRTIGKGQKVTALAGQVWARPQRATILKSDQEDTARGIKPGAVVFVLFPLGEGAYVVWSKGKMYGTGLDIEFRLDNGRNAHNGREALDYNWWVRVRLADGSTAWVKDPSRHFDGTDAYE